MSMSMRSAMQIKADYRFRLNRVRATGEYRVTLEEWTRDEAERGEYFTDDLEDAVMTGMQMRRHSAILFHNNSGE